MSFDLMQQEKQYLNMLKEAEIIKHVGKGPVDPAPKEKEAKSPVEDGEGAGTQQAGTEYPNEIPPVKALEKELAKEEVDRIISGGLVEDIRNILEKKGSIYEQYSAKIRNRMATIAAANAGREVPTRYVPGSPAAVQAARQHLATKKAAAMARREQDEDLKDHDEEKETPEEEKAESPEMQKKEKEAGIEKHDTKTGEVKESRSHKMKRVMVEHIRNFLGEQEPQVKIPVKHPGVLEVPEGKDVESLGEDHFKSLIDKKGWEEISKALTNLHTWNKDKNPSLASWANNMQEKLAKWVEGKRESGEMKEQANPAVARMRQPISAYRGRPEVPPASITKPVAAPAVRPVSLADRMRGQAIPNRPTRIRL
jgi:hypothetical protein